MNQSLSIFLSLSHSRTHLFALSLLFFSFLSSFLIFFPFDVQYILHSIFSFYLIFFSNSLFPSIYLHFPLFPHFLLSLVSHNIPHILFFFYLITSFSLPSFSLYWCSHFVFSLSPIFSSSPTKHFPLFSYF